MKWLFYFPSMMRVNCLCLYVFFYMCVLISFVFNVKNTHFMAWMSSANGHLWSQFSVRPNSPTLKMSIVWILFSRESFYFSFLFILCTAVLYVPPIITSALGRCVCVCWKLGGLSINQNYSICFFWKIVCTNPNELKLNWLWVYSVQ